MTDETSATAQVAAEASTLNSAAEGKIDEAANLAKAGVDTVKDYIANHEDDIQGQIDQFAQAAKDELSAAEKFVEEHTSEVAAVGAAVAGAVALGAIASEALQNSTAKTDGAQTEADANAGANDAS